MNLLKNDTQFNAKKSKVFACLDVFSTCVLKEIQESEFENAFIMQIFQKTFLTNNPLHK